MCIPFYFLVCMHYPLSTKYGQKSFTCTIIRDAKAKLEASSVKRGRNIFQPELLLFLLDVDFVKVISGLPCAHKCTETIFT